MSNDSEVAIVLSSVNKNMAFKIIRMSLNLLINDYMFGFRSYGGVFQLLFEDNKFFGESPIDSEISSASLIDLSTIRYIESQYKGFSINGSIRLSGLDSLVDLDIIFLPVFDVDDKSCVVFRIEEDVYWRLWDENDILNEDLKETLLTLVIELGANNLVDAFHARLLVDLSDIQCFDGVALRESLLQPAKLQDLAKGAGLNHGFITGIKTSLLSLNEIGDIWKVCDKFETTNGFAILDDLVEQI